MLAAALMVEFSNMHTWIFEILSRVLKLARELLLLGGI